VPDLELPTNLVREMAEYDAPDAPRRTWLADLPAVVATVSREWSLDVGRPFQPGGVTSWTAPARTAAGERVVLKVGWRHDEALHEADGLAAWNGDGAVRLLDHRVLDHTTALLLEACEPGTPLSDVRPPEEQDVVIAGLLRRLWIEPPAGTPFRPLTGMCDVWADEFEEKLARTPRLDPGLARAGMELFRELPRTATQSRLLCTDLHPDNVLSAAREPWLVIDPKPYVGDPMYDVLQHMLDHVDRLAADPVGFSNRMAGLLGLEVERLQLWLFARCVEGSIDQPRLGHIAAMLRL